MPAATGRTDPQVHRDVVVFLWGLRHGILPFFLSSHQGAECSVCLEEGDHVVLSLLKASLSQISISDGL